MDIYKTPNFTKCFHFYHYRKLLFIDELLPLCKLYCPIIGHFSVLVHVLEFCEFSNVFLGFLVYYYYGAIPFHIGEGALECHMPYNFQITKDAENQANFNCSSGMHL